MCRRGDIKCLEDLVPNASSVGGRASVEEEVILPGHFDILKGDGGRVDHTVPEVRQEYVDACRAHCQGHTNVFHRNGMLEESYDVLKAWRMAAEGLIVDDVCIVKVDSCPQVVCVDGNF